MKINLIVLFLSISISSFGQFINGIGKTYSKDDFASINPYSSAKGSVLWTSYNTNLYALTRTGTALKLDATNADPYFNGFNVSWGADSTNNEALIDLTQNARIFMVVENPGSSKIWMNFYFYDVNNKSAYILNDTSQAKNFSFTSIEAGTTDTIEIDMTGGYVPDWLKSSANPPYLTNDFDWSKVKGLSITINGGGGQMYQIPPTTFTGTIYIKDFLLGDIPCLGATGNIAGKNGVCENETASYKLPVVDQATDYLWVVPSDATITYGQGTDSITVNFGSLSGQINVTPSNTCKTGKTATLNVNLTLPIGATGIISGTTNLCGYQKNLSYSLPAVNNASSYSWSLPMGANIISGSNTNNIVTDMGDSSGIILVIPSNACGAGDTQSLFLNVRKLIKPVISSSGTHITSISASEYQWLKDGAMIPGATSQDYEVTASGGYSVVTSGNDTCMNVSDEIYIGISGINGAGKNYAKDDFGQLGQFINNTTSKGVYWIENKPMYNLTRTGVGKLKVDVLNADPGYQGFYMFLGNDSLGNPATIDLSSNANIHLVVENTNADIAFVNFYIIDINDRMAYVLNDTSNSKDFSFTSVAAGVTDTIDIDMTGGYAPDWNVFVNNMPYLRQDFDWTKVKGLSIVINGGGDQNGSPVPSVLTGSLYLKDFQIGSLIHQAGHKLSAIPTKGYLWRKDGNVISGATDSVYYATQSGIYDVSLKDIDNSLIFSNKIKVGLVTGINNTPVTNVVKIYPNPTTGLVKIENLFNNDPVLNISVSDIYGKKYFYEYRDMNQADLSSLPTGIYFIEISTTQGTSTFKIIKN